MRGVYERVVHTQTNLQLSAASLFKYVRSFKGHRHEKVEKESVLVSKFIEAYLEPCQTFKMEIFAKIDNG